ncbi:MAG: ribosome biogenesis GTP-binding protein YihA/YsxC, partial [Bacteroidota bacterium]|nr:ribosome biogenesis GTP-binding protein YihA/YsxC [Bacteroidota bacterium]
HFLINESWYLVDLPGYGWAKVSQTSREKWSKMVKAYLRNRANLACVFLLIDSRLEPQKSDLEFIQTLGEMGVPFVLVFTKADKQSVQKTQANIATFRRTLLESWEELPPIFITSSEEKKGREELLQFIQQTNDELEKN